MRKRTRAILVMLVLLAGCAQQPVQEIKPSQDTTGAEPDSRLRARLHTELAGGYYELGNMSVALEEVNVALRADPNYAPAHNVAGLVYARLKEDQLAEQSFTQALQIDPLDADANNNFGLFLCQRKREKESMKYFLAALRNPLYQYPERTYVNAGVCARQMGDMAGAQAYFMNALKMRPSQPQALYQLADLDYARGEYEAAKQRLDRFMKVAQPTPEVLWLGLRVERKLGNRNAEQTYAHQLRTHFPQSQQAQALSGGRYE